jgi:DNA invertase Pin-like site-specific DNA recombinase
MSRTSRAQSWRAPELCRLIGDANTGEILLVEQVDRLSRFSASDWEVLKHELTAKHSPSICRRRG